MRKWLLGICAVVSFVVLCGILLLNAAGLPQRNVLASHDDMPTIQKITDEPKQLCFPCSVPDTNIIIESVVMYDGPFLEQNPNREVFCAAAAVLRNAGSVGIVRANVFLKQPHRTLKFEVEALPPGQATLALEKSAVKLDDLGYTECGGDQELAASSWLSPQSPKVEPVGMTQLRVMNNGRNELKNIWIYYKTYAQDASIYLGGVAYKVGIRSLKPGHALTINPPYYVARNSRIIRITIGEMDNMH